MPRVIVAGLASPAQAKAWIAEEPYVATGVFAQDAARPFRKGFPQ